MIGSDTSLLKNGSVRDFAPESSSHAVKDFFIDKVGNSVHCTVAENELSGARVAAAKLFEIRVNPIRRPDGRTDDSRYWILDAVHDANPSRKVDLAAPFADKDGVGQAIANVGKS